MTDIAIDGMIKKNCMMLAFSCDLQARRVQAFFGRRTSEIVQVRGTAWIAGSDTAQVVTGNSWQ